MSATLNKFSIWILLTACAAGTAATTRADGQEQAAPRKITTRVQPVYPEIAKKARLSGVVKLVLIVTPEGSVKTVRTLGGNPVLAIAAEEAVRQWKYEPLKKESTEAVTVNFEGQD